MIEIKSLSGELLASYDVESLREAVEKAVDDGKELTFANLRFANLRGANLLGANLLGADLRDAYLRDAYLHGADLHGADLRGADLRDAYLSDAYLHGADLHGADLRDAYLSGAEMAHADTDKRYIQIGCIGRCKRITTYCVDDNIVWCGCFTGTLEEFEERVKVTHADNNQYLEEYLGAINYFKQLKDMNI